LSLAGVGLTLRVAAWRRARCSSAAKDVSGAAGRRATTCATAAMREVFECCMLDELLTKDRRLREPCARCCSVAGVLGDMLGVDSRESLLLEKRLRSLWGLSHAGVGLTLRVAEWRRARCSSAAADVSDAAGRRATTCATAAMREVLECCMLDVRLMSKDGRLREPCASCCSVDESSDQRGPIVFRTVLEIPVCTYPSDVVSQK
jgi:hypothetical protein